MTWAEECPPWFIFENSSDTVFPQPQCVCSNAVKLAIVCDQRTQSSSIHLGFCAVQDLQANRTVVAACVYVFPKHLIKNNIIFLPKKVDKLNQFICGSLSRDIDVKSPLCGRCANGTGPSIYFLGSRCVKCSGVNIVYYILLQYLPNTIIFLIIIVFRVNITAPPMSHYVIFCNSIVLLIKSMAGGYGNLAQSVSNENTCFEIISKILLTMYAIWSFDTFIFVSPPLCVSVHMQEIYLPYLDTLAIIYPFILLLLTYTAIQLHSHDYKLIVSLWRLLHRTYVKLRRTWDPNASMLQAFAAILFLSYTKFILLMYEPLLFSTVYNNKDQIVTHVTYIDPTVPVFSPKHFHLIPLSVVIFIFVIASPIVLLIIFPKKIFKIIRGCLKRRWILSISIFVDTIQGCYKDGTNMSRDYRAISGYILAIWALVPAIDITTRAIGYPILSTSFLFTTFFILLTVICALIKPYKNMPANVSAVTLLALMASTILLFVSAPMNTWFSLIILSFLLCIPHCVFYGYLVCTLINRMK